MDSNSDSSYSLDLTISGDNVYLEEPEENSRTRSESVEQWVLKQPLRGPLSIDEEEHFEDYGDYGPPSMTPLRSVDIHAPPKTLRGPDTLDVHRAKLLQFTDGPSTNSKQPQPSARCSNSTSDSNTDSSSYNMPYFLDEMASDEPSLSSVVTIVGSVSNNTASEAPSVVVPAPPAAAAAVPEDKPMKWNRRAEEEFKRSGRKVEKEVQRLFKRLF